MYNVSAFAAFCCRVMPRGPFRIRWDVDISPPTAEKSTQASNAPETQRGPRQTPWWRALEFRALLWPVFARSSWDQPGIVVAGTTSERAALASVRFFGVGSYSHCVEGHDK